MTRIGVGFDGRPESEQALAAAIELARACGAEIEVVSVIGAPVADADELLYDPEWLAQTRAAAEEELETTLRGLDVRHTGRVVAGTVVEQLTDLSTRVDLLVVGSRAWGPVRRTLVGSTAAHLMREAHCPVVVLPRGAPTGEPGEREPGATAGVA